MEFTECVKGKLTLTLKSSLLCAIMLMPVTALADSLETDSNGEADQATLATSSDSIKHSSTIPANEQSKHARLSMHIQRKYQVPGNKAKLIVAEAISNSETHKVDPELILAIIAVESTFKERAVSREGARGLMQVLPGAHRNKIRDIGGSQALFDPAMNIHMGSQILVKYLSTHSGNLRQALLSYNGSLGSRSSFPERVLRIYRDLQRATTEG